MKKRNLLTRLLLSVTAVGIISLTLPSCEKDEATPAPKNIVETAQADTTFSILVAAVVKTNLTSALSTTANLTVFAPVNNAFRALGYNETNIAALDATGTAALKAVLQYHVLGEKVPASAITTTNIEKTTLGGSKLYATKNSAGVFINGVKVIAADVSASNGIIHAVESVLLPPAGNIVESAVATPDFSYLVAAVLRADASGTSISGALSGAGPFTVFAPTNQAFIDAGFPTIASINAADPNTLKNILLYHVVGARVFSSDLTEGITPTTLQGGTVTITLSGGAKVKGAANPSAANITRVNVMATNGVIHIINKVLLP